MKFVKNFLKIDDLSSEASNHDPYKGWIPIVSHSYHLNLPIGKGPGGIMTAGRAEWSDLLLIKHCDSTTPHLAQKCAEGSLFTSAQLVILEGSNAEDSSTYRPVITICFGNLYVIGYKNYSDSQSNTSLEEIRFYYGKIKWEHHSSVAKGKPDHAFRAGWDRENNVRWA